MTEPKIQLKAKLLEAEQKILRKAHGELQILVQERTAELEKANEALQAKIQERKRTEEDLKQRTAELTGSNAELEQFAYIASHDLQEPLRMISGFAQLLERRYRDKLNKDANEFMDYIVDGAKRMQSMIEDLLTYSRIGTRGKQFEPTNLEDVLNQVVTNLKTIIEENKAQVTHDPLPIIIADASQMTQLLQNLIANAIKFRKRKSHHVFISLQRENGMNGFSR